MMLVRNVQSLWVAGCMIAGILFTSCNGSSSGQKESENDHSVKAELMLIHQLGHEHIGDAVYRRGINGPTIAASGNRILEFPVQESAPLSEVVPRGGSYTNGACTFDLNNDGIDEVIIGRESKTGGTDLIWYEEVAGQKLWKEHLIANVNTEEGDAEKGFHDIIPFEARVTDKMVRGIALTTARKRLSWFQPPDDENQAWTEHKIADMKITGVKTPQSGLASGDLAGKGRLDLLFGNFWAECPENPAVDSWKIHRYSNWDRRIIPQFEGVPEWVKNEKFGGMNQLDVGDMDGDGNLDIVATEAEIPEARIGIFCRDLADPSGLWKEALIDTGIYCPHSLVVTDVNNDSRPDILVGEMTAGGWWFPRNPAPKLYLYINKGNMEFQKQILYEGRGIHMMRLASERTDNQIFVYAADEIQSWFRDMNTHVVGWLIR